MVVWSLEAIAGKLVRDPLGSTAALERLLILTSPNPSKGGEFCADVD